MKAIQPDLIPGLPSSPSRILITDKVSLNTINRIEGMMISKDVIKELQSNLPGLKFALTAIDAKIHEQRSLVLTRLAMEAAKSGADMNNNGIVGIDPTEGEDVYMMLESFEQMEKEYQNSAKK
jgi:uncharacterized protein YbjQ (UPF0145 family)